MAQLREFQWFSPSYNKNKMLLKRLLVALVCCTCLELLFLLGMVVFWKSQRNRILATKESHTCFIESDIPTVFRCTDGIQKHFDVHKNKTQICGPAKCMLQNAMNKTIGDRYNSDANPDLINHTDLMGRNNCRKIKNIEQKLNLKQMSSYGLPIAGKPTKIYWQQTDSTTNLRHLDQEGVVIIRQAGIYFLSSQLTVWFEDDEDSVEFGHFVNLISHNKRMERVLLENKISECSITTQESKKTSKLEAVFHFEENDRIYVATTLPHKLVAADMLNHLFVYKL